MLHNIWNAVLYKPLINALAFLISIIPGGDVGIAIVIITILVKILLLPLSERQIRNQAAMQMLAPELDKIKKSGASKEEQARLQWELYKKHKTNPLSGCLPVIPTIFVLIALSSLFFRGINFDASLLYSFVHVPEKINMLFLGVIDISQKSFIIAVIAALSQYFQAYFMPQPPAPKANSESFQDNLAKSMGMQMKYFFPILIFVFLYTGIPKLIVPLSGAAGLYWIINNIFTILQQIYIKKTEVKVLDEEVKELRTK